MATAEEAARQTTMEALKPADSRAMPAVSMGFGTLQSFELMQRAAKLLASSSLVPQQYQGNLPNCVIALNMANRIGADPLMVMQNLYVVHGRPSWSAQFVIACFNQCGRFSAMRYRWFNRPTKDGDIPDNWGCQAYATELSTGEKIEGPTITIATAKREGWWSKKDRNGRETSKWQSIPELMLMYRAGSWLQRTHAPDISMGLQTAEEIHDVYDARKGADGQYEVTLDGLRGVGGEATEPDKGVDTETGEVVTGRQDDEPPKPLPKGFDVADEEKTLRSKKTLKTLLAAWTDLRKRLDGAEVPLELTAAYEDQREALGEREAIQGENAGGDEQGKSEDLGL